LRIPKSKLVLLAVVILVAVSAAMAGLAPAVAEAEESCVDCHTNKDLLISLIPEKEEEAAETGES
jgi:nitrate/TMAO reductase-like tetraheme cytochrome c subunit